MRRPLALLIALGVTLGACGSEERAPDAAPGTPDNPLVATQPGETTTASSGAPEAAKVPRGEPSGAAANPNFKALLERQKAKPQERFTPCNLVTQREAERIVGEEMRAPFEAPQGPTCIYQPQSGTELIAVAVQQTSFGSIRRRMDDLRRTDVAGKKAYCGTDGQPMLYLPLDGGRLLSVSATCEIARSFATKALPHL